MKYERLYTADEVDGMIARAKAAAAQPEQEPVAWLGFNPRTGAPEFSCDKPAPSVMRDYNMKPLAYTNSTPPAAQQIDEAYSAGYSNGMTEGYEAGKAYAAAQPVQVGLNVDPTPISGWGQQSIGMGIPSQPEQEPDPIGDAQDRLIAEMAAQPAQEPVGDEWTPCMKLPVVVHVRKQRHGEAHVSTREGITPVKPDDLIMRGVSGEEYPIGRAIFEQTYTMDTTPPAAAQRPWVELTEQEELDCFSPNPVTHSKNVGAKLKEKNT
jgi:hypothetical protein